MALVVSRANGVTIQASIAIVTIDDPTLRRVIIRIPVAVFSSVLVAEGSGAETPLRSSPWLTPCSKYTIS